MRRPRDFDAELQALTDKARQLKEQKIRQLIELGGLIAKAGLIELTDDDRSLLFGLLVEAAAKLSGDNAEQQLVIWPRRGKRAFEQTRSD